MRSSTLNFESKHPFFKATLRAKKCCKNVTKTLSHEHQVMMSNVVDSIVDDMPRVTNCRPLVECEFSADMIAHLTSFFGEPMLKCAVFGDKLVLNGVAYSAGVIIVCKTNQMSLDLCLVQTLITIGRRCYAAGMWTKPGCVSCLQVLCVSEFASLKSPIIFYLSFG